VPGLCEEASVEAPKYGNDNTWNRKYLLWCGSHRRGLAHTKYYRYLIWTFTQQRNHYDFSIFDLRTNVARMNVLDPLFRDSGSIRALVDLGRLVLIFTR
jgi:hypothetical protein